MKKLLVFLCAVFVSTSVWAVTCDAGYYLPADATECVQCPAGKYSTVEASSCSNVTAGYFCSGGCKTATPTSGSDCLTGNTCGKCTRDSATGHPAYTDAAGGAASCSVCPEVTGDLASRATGFYNYYPEIHNNGVSGCYAVFRDSDPNATFTTICYHGSGDYGDSKSSCQTYAPTACAAGKYKSYQFSGAYAYCKGIDCMKGKICTDTDAGYYSPEGDLTQTPCPVNSYSDAGAGSCAACANGTFAPTGSAVCYPHIMHVGNDKIYLSSDKTTTPSLNVKIGDEIFYANMTPIRTKMNKDSEHYLRVRWENNDYYVCDDTTCQQ